jgi:hypothetical protein
MIIQEENPAGDSETSEFEGFESHMKRVYDHSSSEFASKSELPFKASKFSAQPRVQKKFRSILTLNEFDALEESGYMFGNLREKCRSFAEKIAYYCTKVFQDAKEQINMSFVDVVVTSNLNVEDFYVKKAGGMGEGELRYFEAVCLMFF